MIIECYIKGRYDFGVGKCAVVIVDDGAIVHQRAWVVKDPFIWDGVEVSPDQFNCEIIAATYAMHWCSDNGRQKIVIYANTKSCKKWYGEGDFPEGRVIGSAFRMYAKGRDVSSMWIPKDCDEAQYAEYNYLVNKIAEELR